MEQTEPNAAAGEQSGRVERRVINSRAVESGVTVGDYVFASRWYDCDWNDPWAVGFVSLIGKNFVEVDNGDGGLIDGVGHRGWKYCMKISGEVGAKVIDEYTALEGTAFVPHYAAELFGVD